MLSNYCILCVIVLIQLITAGDVGDKCTPNSEESDGVCTVISDCAVALSQIKVKNYHDFKRCGFEGMNEVMCCPTTQDKFGVPTEHSRGNAQGNTGSTERTRAGQRKADVECQKIIASSIPPLSLHIIGGELAALGEFPHMVALGFERQSGLKFDCGGSLLSDRYVLTAAHCVDTLDQIEPTIVRMGVADLGGSTFQPDTDVRVASIIKHPEYTRREKYHDLALIRLAKSVQFNTNLNAVCLYTRSEEPTTRLTVTGWGTTSTTNTLYLAIVRQAPRAPDQSRSKVSEDARSNVLLKANVTVVPRSQCGESYTKWKKLPVGISAQQLCAGDPQGLHDTCQGDSGGPLVGLTHADGQHRLVGVTSFGRGCGSPVPGVYTYLARYLDWLERVVWG